MTPRFGHAVWATVLVPATGLIVLSTIGSYVLAAVHADLPAIRQLHLPPSLAYYSVMAAGLVQFVLSPCFGALADRIGAARVMAPGGLLVGLGIYPALVFIDAAPSVMRLVSMQFALGIGLAAYFAPVPALMGRLFPTASPHNRPVRQLQLCRDDLPEASRRSSSPG